MRELKNDIELYNNGNGVYLIINHLNHRWIVRGTPIRIDTNDRISITGYVLKSTEVRPGSTSKYSRFGIGASISAGNRVYVYDYESGDDPELLLELL